MNSVALAIELLVALLLMITIAYCWLLNHRLKSMRADEHLMRETVDELVAATEVADQSILSLRKALQNSESTLAKRIEEAHSVQNALDLQLDKGQGILQQFAQIVIASGAASGAQKTPENRAQRPAPSIVEAPGEGEKAA